MKSETESEHSGSGSSGNGHGKFLQIHHKLRRHSAAAIHRIRTGSLPSWAGGPPAIIQHSTTPTIDEEHEFEFPHEFEESAEEEAGSSLILDIEHGSIKSRQGSKVETTPSGHDPRLSRVQGNVDLGLVLSAMYAKLLIVMGIAFPLSEVMSTFIPPKFYDGFYIYLYCMSILFMLYILGNVVKQKVQRSARGLFERFQSVKTKISSSSDSGVAVNDCELGEPYTSPSSSIRKKNVVPEENPQVDSGNSFVIDTHRHSHGHSHGHTRLVNISFYLRMGAMAFGIGSLIYSGLEFGQYFELDKKKTKCHNYTVALTPAVRMIFTFLQMYFIFLNSEKVFGKTSLGVQFGLMHMIGTNLCVWLNVLVEETRHEILHFYDPTNHTVRIHHGHHDDSQSHESHHHYDDIVQSNVSTAVNYGKQIIHSAMNEEHHAFHRVKRGLSSMYECRRSNIMGSLVDSASPFLFPCTIEYSLICAAICYVMWKSTAKRRAARYKNEEDKLCHLNHKRSRHHYTVDCSRANKGLFLGIFFLVLTIMSLIVNFVLVPRPGYEELAMLQFNIMEMVIYTITTLAVLLGMCQMRELKFQKGRNLELDNTLLIIAQTGSFIYNVFSIIGGQFAALTDNKLVLITPLASLIQLLLQTLFILDASRRTPATLEQAKRKPGREVVTFLLVTNLAMWLINTLENSRGDSHPVQLQFFGIWAWTIITDISMPLAIFYRFHSTVCLCEIWKKAYKMKTSP